MKCFGCGSEEHLERHCPNKSGGASQAHFTDSSVVMPGNSLYVHAGPTMVYGSERYYREPEASVGEASAVPFYGAIASSHQQEQAMETQDDPTIVNGIDPQFQNIIRRHGLLSMPQDLECLTNPTNEDIPMTLL